MIIKKREHLQGRETIIKPYLNAVVIGHVASGKSTVSGRLVYECDGIDEELMTKFESEANEVRPSRLALFGYIE